MKEIKKTKKAIGLLAFALVTCFLLVTTKESKALTPAVNANQNTPQTNKTGNFDELDGAMDQASGQMNSYLSSLSTKNQVGPFFEKGVQEVLPFYSNPFVKFDLSFSKEKKGPLLGGGFLALNGTIGFNTDSNLEKQNFLTDCKQKYGVNNKCLNSDVYNLQRIANVGVFAQIFRKDESGEKSLLGDYLVDEFYVATDLTLTAGQKRDFQVSWKIPADSKPGDYYIAFYLNSNKNFDLWGTPLTAFSFAKTYDFSLAREDETNKSMGVEIDKNSITVNKIPYAYRKPAPTITKDEKQEVTVELPVTNLNSKEEKTSITYQLFSWGQTDPKNLISTKEESKTFAAGEKANLSFSFTPEDTQSVYNLKVIASGENSKSVSNVRFVMKDKSKGVFRFLGLVGAEKENTFSPLFCLRNASWEGISKGKVKISLLDSKGDKQGGFEEVATIGSETRCFVPQEIKTNAATCLKLQGEIFDESDKLIQKEEINYPCESVSGTPSTLDNLISQASQTDNGIVSEKTKVLLILGAILLVLIGIAVILNNKKNKQ